MFGGNVFIYSGVGGPIDVCDCTLRDNLVRWGFQLIDYIELEIGGQLIDKQYGEWMDIWAQLSSSTEEWTKLNRIVDGSLLNSNTKSKLYIPLQFWFCRNPGLALPLIALSSLKILIVHMIKLVNYIFHYSSGSAKIRVYTYL